MSNDYGEAHGWTGDDERDFGPSPDEERCWCCLASEDEDCTPDCFCAHCLRTREPQPDGDAPRGSEASADAADEQIARYLELK